MRFEGRRLVAWKVALCALVRFLPSMDEGVGLQITFLTKWLVALLAIVFLDFKVNLLVTGKAATLCKCLWTHITRNLFFHPQFLTPLPTNDLFWLIPITGYCLNFHFPFYKQISPAPHELLRQREHRQWQAVQSKLHWLNLNDSAHASSSCDLSINKLNRARVSN